MKIITSEQKLADIVLKNYHLIPVINGFGIELGFGDKSIADVCLEHEIDNDFFSALLNIVSYDAYIFEQNIGVLNIPKLIFYLRSSLVNYQKDQVNVINIHISQLISSSSVKTKNLELIENFYLSFKKEFEEYFLDVDGFYSYIIKVFDEFTSDKKTGSFDKLNFDNYSRKYSILNEKLSDMKSLLVKYLKGDFDSRIRNAIIYIISRFQSDLHSYIRLQNRLLKPMVEEMFNQIKTI